MANETTCAQCGRAITEESPTGDPTKRRLCPDCQQSTARTFSVQGEARATATAKGQIDVKSYPQTLLSTAKSLLDAGEFSIAVVVAHMACEVATEWALSNAFANKNVQYLESSVSSFLNGYNMGNKQIRKLYTSLTGDEIQNEPFWSSFTSSVTRRNKIIHGGLTVNMSDAEESHNAATSLVAHLNK